MNARLHSAGHLLDSAVHRLGLDVSPGKGYHFPDGAYVEYTGSIPAEDRERVKQDIEQGGNEESALVQGWRVDRHLCYSVLVDA